MSKLRWNWVYLPYLDAPNKQKESALTAGYIKVVSKDEADKLITEKDEEIRRLKEMMPKYKEFIEDEDYRKKLVDEYAGYVYEWAGHRYIATPYINVFIKGLLRTLYKALANWAHEAKYAHDEFSLWENMERKCLKKVKEFGG